MKRWVLSLDQGTTFIPRHASLTREEGASPGGGVPPAFPGTERLSFRPRLAEADDPARSTGGPREGGGIGDVRRHRKRALNDVLGSGRAASGSAAPRLAGQAHGRRLQGARAPRIGRFSGEGRGSCSTPTLLGPNSRGPWTHPGGAAQGRAGGARVRGRGHLAPLEADNGRVHATDASDASRTLIAGLKTGEWDRDLMRLLRIPEEVLPGIGPSSGVLGEIASIAELQGVVAGDRGRPAGRPVRAGVFPRGHGQDTYGTGCLV